MRTFGWVGVIGLVGAMALSSGCTSSSAPDPTATATQTATNTPTATPTAVLVTIAGNVTRTSSTTCAYHIWMGVFYDGSASSPYPGYNWYQETSTALAGPFSYAYSQSVLLPVGTYYMGGLHASQICFCGPCTGYNQSIDPWATTSFTVTVTSTTISGVNINIP